MGFFVSSLPTQTVILNTMLENNNSAKEIFKAWHLLFKKDYSLETAEAKSRFAIFKQKLAEIKAHNADSTKSWRKGLNQFSDMTKEEINTRVLSRIDLPPKPEAGVISSNGYYETKTYFAKEDSPSTWAEIDYTTQCGKVWNQNPCGCCYAFAMLNAVECNYNIAKGVLPALSRQQVVDCNGLTHGCSGGNPSLVSFYAKSQGMMDDAAYPFKGEVQTCQYDAAKTSVYVDGAETTGTNFPAALGNNPFQSSHTIYNMLTRGSLSVCLDATPIMDYESGIIDLYGCTESNHAVMIVGYGVENGTPYWKVKNSWDTWWGDSGYMKVKVKDDAQNNCFLYNEVYRPFKN